MFPFGFGRLGSTEAGFGQQRTRAQTLNEHHSALRELKSSLSKRTGHHLPSVVQKKVTQQLKRVPRMEKCKPISIRNLDCGAVHVGGVLKGRLVTEAIKMQSVQSVLEDEAGNVMTVHMYNIPSLPATTTTLADLEAAQRLFPQGQGLAIIEPFYKIMLDGTPGVRVDNPAEIIFLDKEGNPLRSAAEIKAQAGSYSCCGSSSTSTSRSLSQTETSWARPVLSDPSAIGKAVKPKRPNKSKKSSKGKQR